MRKPWEMPWDFVSNTVDEVTAEREALVAESEATLAEGDGASEELRQEGIAMMADLPVMSSAPPTETLVTAPVQPSAAGLAKGMLPWEMDWGGPSVDSTELPASDSALVEQKVAVDDPKWTPDMEPETKQILSDEGTRKVGGKHVSYLDTATPPVLTGGHGHAMTAAERKKYPEGSVIPEKVVEEWWQEDAKSHIKDADRLIGDTKLPSEARDIIINMVFNLGATRAGRKKGVGFAKMWEALDKGDFDEAANQMVDSDWYSQVGARSKRLVKRMRNLGNKLGG